MPQLQVPIVRTANLPYDCWPALPETLFEDIVARIIGQFTNNMSGVIISDTAPAPNDRDKLWFDTNNNDNNIYSWVTDIGNWARPNPTEPASDERRLWVGSEASVWSYEGGDGNDPSVTAPGAGTGAMWEVDHNFDGRVPLGPGTLPSTTVVNVGATGGEEKHSLTTAEMPPHVHHFTVIANNAAASGTGELTGGEFNSPNDGKFIGDTDNAGGVSNGATPPVYTVTPHNTLPPYIGTFVIKRTARIWMIAP